MSVRGKIILAYGLLFGVSFGLMWAVATRLISAAVENQFEVQAAHAGNLFSSWNVPLDPGFVAASIRKVYGADAAVLDDFGRWGSTLEGPAGPAFEQARRAGALGALAAPGRVTAWRLADGRETLAVYVPYRTRREPNSLDAAPPPPSREGALYLFYPAEQVEAEKARARRPLLTVGLAGLLLVAGLGVGIARTVTQPLERLAARTRDIAAGHLEPAREPAPAPGPGGNGAGNGVPAPARDEVGELTASFDRMVEGLRRYQEDLLRAGKLAVTGQIAAGIAHEIRNPLTAMRMTVQLLAREEGDPARRESLDLLLREIGRLETAVSELMDLASPAPPRREPVDLNRVVGEVLALVRPQAAHHGAEIVHDLLTIPPVSGDANRLRRVVLNLVLNGLQAMPERGRLTVRTRALSPVPGPMSQVETAAPAAGARQGTGDRGQTPVIRLEVCDTGRGIPPELRDRMFEPFVTAKPGGNGLGLALAKRIVEEHGGLLDFETGGGGTTFRVDLPAS